MTSVQEKWQTIHSQMDSKIVYENSLMNSRLTWLGTFEGLLLAAISFSWGKSTGLIVSLCSIGFLISISIGISTRRANIAIEYYRNWWDKNKPEDALIHDVEGYRSGTGFLWFLMPGAFIPWCFAVLYVVLGLLVLS